MTQNNEMYEIKYTVMVTQLATIHFDNPKSPGEKSVSSFLKWVLMESEHLDSLAETSSGANSVFMCNDHTHNHCK